MNKPVIIVQARMSSERLPGKVLMNLEGKPLIGILFERLRKSGYPIVLATSTEMENDPLVEYTKSIGIKVYRGSEDNVLARYYHAAKKYKAEIIIRITGDNPLVDGEFIKRTLEEINGFGTRTYFSSGISKTYPLGCSFEAFSMELLEEAFFNATKPGEKEHVTPYMHQNVPGDIDIKTKQRPNDKSKYRLTVDTKADYDLMKILIDEFKCHKNSMDEIIALLDNHPELAAINQDQKQKAWWE